MDLFYLPAEGISCWLPFRTSSYFIEDYYGNRTLYPQIVAETREYYLLQQAILRATLRYLVAQTEDSENHPVMTFENFLAVAETGITLFPPLYTISTNRKEAVQIMLDGLAPSSTPVYWQDDKAQGLLCYAVCVEGHGFDATRDEFTIENTQGKQIPLHPEPDSLTWFEIAYQEIDLHYKLHKGMINGKQQGTISLGGLGELGLVFDLRGRPLLEPKDTSEDSERIKKWLAAATTSHRIE